MIMWNHIMDKQPEHGRTIIHIDRPHEGHYSMGMREYVQYCTWEEVLENYRKLSLFSYKPDFWWVYKEDFPFPDSEETFEKCPVIPSS